MEELNIKDNYGNSFVVKIQNGKYEIFKRDGNNLVNANAKELEFVLSELKKLRGDLFQQGNKLEDFKKLLKQMIDNGTIKDYESLKAFINNSDLSNEKKDELLNNGLGELDLQDIIDLKNKIIESLDYDKKSNLKAMVSFNIKNNSLGPRYCEIKVGYKENENTIVHISKIMNYNETLKKELIEPITLEVALRGKVKNTLVTKEDDVINERGNFRLSTENDTYLGVSNTEYEYAQKLESRCKALKNQNTIGDSEQRSAKVSELQNAEYQNDMEDTITDENGNVYDRAGNRIGLIGEDGNFIKEKDRGVARVRVKENGFTMVLIIALTSLFSSLFIVLQMILFGK